ncbi:Uncharacterised protein [Acinetobacter baumannii]|nr:Uncharacterised protein [Acinetobacter baumannii]
MFAGRLHDLTADRRAAGEHQMVERQLAESGPDVRPAGHDGDLIGGKQRRQHRFDEAAGMWRELRRFQHHAVAGGQGGGQRDEGQRKRVVPRRHDANHALGLILHIGACGLIRQGDVAALRLHEAFQVAQQVIDRLNGDQNLQNVGFVRRTVAKVRADGRRQRGALGQNGASQAAQGGLALVHRRRAVAQEGVALGGKPRLHRHEDVISLHLNSPDAE